MPPYKPVKSKAQRGMLFHLAEEGKLSMDEARGKARAARGKKLPVHVKKKVGAGKAPPLPPASVSVGQMSPQAPGPLDARAPVVPTSAPLTIGPSPGVPMRMPPPPARKAPSKPKSKAKSAPKGKARGKK